MKQKILFLVTIMTAMLLSGCVSMVELPDKKWLHAATVKDSLDRSGTRFGVYVVVGKNDDGTPIFEEDVKRTVAGKNPDGTLVYQTESTAHLAVGPTVAGQAIVGAVSGIGAAATQGLAAIAVAKEQKCTGSNCGGTGTVIFNDARSQSQSRSDAMTDMNVSASAGGACNTLACTGK